MSPEERRRRHPCAESKSPCRPWSAPEQKLQLRGLAELQTLQTSDLRGKVQSRNRQVQTKLRRAIGP